MEPPVSEAVLLVIYTLLGGDLVVVSSGTYGTAKECVAEVLQLREKAIASPPPHPLGMACVVTSFTVGEGDPV